MKIIHTMVLAAWLALAGSSASAETISFIELMVTEIAEAEGVPPDLAHGVVMIESGYDCAAYNRKSGATGIMQTLPSTARSVGVTGDLRDCKNGLVAGMRYLKLAIDAHGADCSGISAYNSGVFAKPRCTSYGRKVMRQMRENA